MKLQRHSVWRLLAVGLFLFWWMVVQLATAAPATSYIPPQALSYLPMVKTEQQNIMPEYPYPEYFAALIEHESCISLTHSKCWNPKSRLKTAREEGAGLGQLTRAYRTNGSLRFDALSDLRRQHSQQLKDLSWDNVYKRPDLQIRAIVIMSNQNYRSLTDVKDVRQRTAMMDSAYNGGIGGVRKERLRCSLTLGCNPNVWFGHVESVCLKSQKVLYAGRSACDINRHHVRDVLITRLPKYKNYYGKTTSTVPHKLQ